MKLSRVTAAMMMVSLSTPLFAASEQVGKLTSATQGTFVAREGKMIPASAGQALFAGDRVVTRGNASAKVSMSNCSYKLAPTSMMSITKGACVAPRSMAVQDDEAAAAGAGEGGAGATSVVVALAAAAAVGLGIYVAVDENDATPASP